MSQDDKYKEIIRKEMTKLTKPVRLKVFTSQRTEADGGKIKACMDCAVQSIRAYSGSGSTISNTRSADLLACASLTARDTTS